MLIHDNTQFSDGFKARLRAAMDKSRSGAGVIAEQRHEPYLKGCRVKDTDRVCYLACGELVNQHGSGAPAFADSLDGQAIESLAMDALVESGSCDHWYTYEKDWGVFEVSATSEK